MISGCQHTASRSLSEFTSGNGLLGVNSTCETAKLQNKNFNSVWTRMRSGFCFRNINSSRISEELKWMKKNKSFVYRSIDRSKPYLFHILSYLEKRNLPHELALLPGRAWFNAPDLKSGVLLKVPGVRIPSSPLYKTISLIRYGFLFLGPFV